VAVVIPPGPGFPANAIAAVCVPTDPKLSLAVDIPVGLLVQLVPLYNSVAPVTVGVAPPYAKANV
jgi:hypothetical protein